MQYLSSKSLCVLALCLGLNCFFEFYFPNFYKKFSLAKTDTINFILFSAFDFSLKFFNS